MERVNEYTSYAKLFRDLADDAPEPVRSEFICLATEWEALARERREIDATGHQMAGTRSRTA